MLLSDECKNHISVCICTYKRPKLLAKLLEKLEVQKTENQFSYSIIIVDNDYRGTAKNLVFLSEVERKIAVQYLIEPEQNISLARNKAIQNAKGALIAFIDDDEYPEEDWLFNLFKSYREYNVAGVLGPVLPFFETEPPEWIKKGNIFRRKSYRTGTILKWNETRSGNFLIKKEIFDALDKIYDVSFGKTGGEDTDLFKRMIEKGHKFVWCSGAIVYESIGSERWRSKWILGRALRTGAIFGRLEMKNTKSYYKVLFTSEIIRNLFIIILIIPFSWICGLNVFWEYTSKLFSNIGKLLGLFGFVIKGYESTK
jgi:glycosyltransferase involved in cell wall biosynthesis